MNKKQERRYRLLDDLLDYALRSTCQFAMCHGPFAPIRHIQTCTRCACIHRAIQMGLVEKDGQGNLKQLSNVDGSQV